jgi:hypothetical protein
MFYLVGVNHEAQRHPPGASLNKDQAKLERCLNAAIVDCHPVLIAVEESEETLREERKGVCAIYESIPRNVAKRRGIEAMLFEPSEAYKLDHGYMSDLRILLELSVAGLLDEIPSNQQRAAAAALGISMFFPFREKFWIEKLKDYLHSNVIAVLGENHVDSFSSRLHALEVPVKVLFRRIGVTNSLLAESEAARNFPIENPDLFSRLLQQFTGTHMALQPYYSAYHATFTISPQLRRWS